MFIIIRSLCESTLFGRFPSGFGWIQIKHNCPCFPTESWPCNCWLIHHLWEGKGCWLLQPLHVSWCQYSLQETSKTSSRTVLLHAPAIPWCLDLHAVCLPSRVCSAVYSCQVGRGVYSPCYVLCQVQPVWVGQPVPLQWSGDSLGQRVQFVQLTVVHYWVAYAAGQRHYSKVRNIHVIMVPGMQWKIIKT